MGTLNFHQLHVFHAVAGTGSFSKAAEALSITQPAVSIQVRKLEKALGSPLLHRTRKGPQLTDTGRMVLGYTQRIFALSQEMQEQVLDIQGLKAGRLTIGSSTTPGEYILPWVIGRFQELYPEIEVSLSISNTQTIVDRIKNRELDLGMMGGACQPQGSGVVSLRRRRHRYRRIAGTRPRWPGSDHLGRSQGPTVYHEGAGVRDAADGRGLPEAAPCRHKSGHGAWYQRGGQAGGGRGAGPGCGVAVRRGARRQGRTAQGATGRGLDMPQTPQRLLSPGGPPSSGPASVPSLGCDTVSRQARAQ